MSGPKVDAAELRRQELERLMKSRQNRLKLSSYIDKKIKEIMNSFTISDNDDAGISNNCNTVLRLQEECSDKLKKLMDKVASGNETLDCKGINLECDSIISDFKQKSEMDLKTIANSRRNNSEYIKQREMRLKQAATKRVKINGLSPITEITRSSVSSISCEQIEKQVVLIENEISDFMNNMSVPSTYKNLALSLHQEIKDIAAGDLDIFKKSKRIERLYNDFISICHNSEKELSEMGQAYEKYCVEFFDLQTSPRPMSSFSSVKEIEEASIVAKEDAKNYMSRDYIKRQIDDVMRIHGYDVVQSELLESTAATGQVLYGVNNDTAIDVFVSNDNQVTMRVVGIGFDDQVSSSENESLYQQQCAFCSMHPQITKELEMRGVILKTKKHLPPDRKFNKKIQTKTKVESKKSSRAKEELKKSGPKAMHKE